MEIHLPMRPSQIDYTTELYIGTSRDAFSRINGMMMQAEQEAYNNFIRLSHLLPEQAGPLIRFAEMERRHYNSFEACGRHHQIAPNLEFAKLLFADLKHLFQDAAANNQIATCLLIQVLGIECFQLIVHENYIPIADSFSRKVTESIINDKYSHFNFCEGWLKIRFKEVKHELKVANRKILPIICRMLTRLQLETQTLGMDAQSLVEDFMSEYDRVLSEIGFDYRDILRMLSHTLIVNQVDSSYSGYQLFFNTLDREQFQAV